VAGGPEHLLESVEYLAAECGEFRSAMVDRWLINRAQYAIGNVGGSRDLEKMASAAMGHRHTPK